MAIARLGGVTGEEERLEWTNAVEELEELHPKLYDFIMSMKSYLMDEVWSFKNNNSIKKNTLEDEM